LRFGFSRPPVPTVLFLFAVPLPDTPLTFMRVQRLSSRFLFLALGLFLLVYPGKTPTSPPSCHPVMRALVLPTAPGMSVHIFQASFFISEFFFRQPLTRFSFSLFPLCLCSVTSFQVSLHACRSWPLGVILPADFFLSFPSRTRQFSFQVPSYFGPTSPFLFFQKRGNSSPEEDRLLRMPTSFFGEFSASRSCPSSLLLRPPFLVVLFFPLPDPAGWALQGRRRQLFLACDRLSLVF